MARAVLRAGAGGHVVRARNALTRARGAKEAISAAGDGRRITWYACGPTVYDDAHLGHARTFVSFDVARRVLARLARVHVDLCVGVTDVDDKIIARAAATGVSARALARRYEARFFADMHALRVLPPSRVARVTDHVPAIVRAVAELVAARAAYVANGDVYFSVRAAGARYGALDPSRGDAVPPPAPPKHDARDFALWKAAAPDVAARGPSAEHARFDSPWGVGRPGWHVECTAMASAVLDHIDIHSGGIDLRFPHHTNELAIAEALRHGCACGDITHQVNGVDTPSDERWVHTWLHAGHLHIEGRKMSKSLKNFITVRDFLHTGGSADAFRMFCLQHRYGTPVEYSDERLRDAEGALARFRRFVRLADAAATDALTRGAVDLAPACSRASEARRAAARARDAVEEALVDDFDTPRALAHLAGLVAAVNRATSSAAAALAAAEAARVVSDTLSLVGISGFGADEAAATKAAPPGAVPDAAIDALVALRAEVRAAAAARNWGRAFAACDAARASLRDVFGVVVADKAEGRSAWQRVGPINGDEQKSGGEEL